MRDPSITTADLGTSRLLEGHDVKVMVGGMAFADAPDLWQRLGADGYAATVTEAVSTTLYPASFIRLVMASFQKGSSAKGSLATSFTR